MLKWIFPPAALVPQKTTTELRRNAITAFITLAVIVAGAAIIHAMFGVPT
jgi:hypothetical protein